MAIFKIPKKAKDEKLKKLSSAQRTELDRVEADAIADFKGQFDELEYVVQEMGAWESEGMVRRYAHLAPAHLAPHVEVIAGLLGGTNSAHTAKEKGPSES